MIKQKVNFLGPLYWFCLIPFLYLLRNLFFFFFVNLGLNVLIPFSSAIASFTIFLLYLIYLRFSGGTFSIKFDRINVLLIFKCLCAIFLLKGIKSFFQHYPITDLVYFFKSFKYMSFSNILTNPVLPENYTPVAILLIGPICEELLFRRVIYNSMKHQANSIPIAIVYSSIIFSLIHYGPNFNIFYAIELFVGGMLLAYCYEKTHNILSSIILHSLANVYTYVDYGLSGYHRLAYYIVLFIAGLIGLAISLIVFLVKRKHNAKITVAEEESALDAAATMVQSSGVDV